MSLQTTEEKLKAMLGDYYRMGYPGSPNAAILQNMLGADNELRDPQSENEALLKLIYEDVIGAVYDARDEAQAAAEAAGTAAEAVANKAPVITDTASGPIASFPDGADGMPVKSLVVNIEPVQEGSGDPSPENVRPITGWTGCNIVRDGKNLFHGLVLPSTVHNVTFSDNGDGGIKLNGLCDASSLLAATINLPAGTYTLSCPYTGTLPVNSSARAQVLNANDGTEYAIIKNNDSQNASDSAAFTGTSFTLIIRIENGFNYDNVVLYPQFEPGSTASDYEACHSVTKQISFPTTIYGGTDEVVSGSGKKTMEIVDLGELNWTRHGTYTNVFYASPTGAANGRSGVVQVMCSAFKPVGSTSTTGISTQEYAVALQTNYATVMVCDPRTYADANAFKAAVSGVKLVYELATPTDFSTTPITVESLYGQNNIFADCGPVSVEYRADTKLYIKRLTGPTDDDMTADANIADNTYFMVGNNLFLSTASIAAGEAIVPGTNCTATNLAAALNALNS